VALFSKNLAKRPIPLLSPGRSCSTVVTMGLKCCISTAPSRRNPSRRCYRRIGLSARPGISLVRPPCPDALDQHELPTHHHALDGPGIPYVLERVRGEDEKVCGPARHENPE